MFELTSVTTSLPHDKSHCNQISTKNFGTKQSIATKQRFQREAQKPNSSIQDKQVQGLDNEQSRAVNGIFIDLTQKKHCKRKVELFDSIESSPKKRVKKTNNDQTKENSLITYAYEELKEVLAQNDDCFSIQELEIATLSLYYILEKNDNKDIADTLCQGLQILAEETQEESNKISYYHKILRFTTDTRLEIALRFALINEELKNNQNQINYSAIEEHALALSFIIEPNCSKDISNLLCDVFQLLAKRQPNIEKKIQFYRKALNWALNEITEADIRIVLAEIYRQKSDYASELHHLKKMTRLPEATKALNMTAAFYLEGREGIESDWKQALRYFKKAVKAGDKGVEYNMAIIYDNKRTEAKNETDREYFRKKAMSSYQKISEYTIGTHLGSHNASFSFLYLSCLNTFGNFSPKDPKGTQEALSKLRAEDRTSKKVPMLQALVAFLQILNDTSKESKIRAFLANAQKNGSRIATELCGLNKEVLWQKLNLLIIDPEPIYREEVM